MGLTEDIQDLAASIPSLVEHLQTEEATKNTLIMPFIAALGYNVQDPREVVLEHVADTPGRSRENVDYAIHEDGKPIIIFECKSVGTNLDDANLRQLYRYLMTTDVRFGILTNGVIYRFHSNLDDSHHMDPHPFLEIDLRNLDQSFAEELGRFAKGSFNLESTLAAAADSKYTRGIKRILSDEMRQPSENFVKLFASQIYDGRLTKPIVRRFTEITQQALNQFIDDRMSERWERGKSLESTESTLTPPTISEPESEDPSGTVVTTDEEREGFFIVKAILRNEVDVSMIVMRDVEAYCGILLDDNNRKPICRLRFNRSQKYLALIIDAKNNEERVSIENIDDIYDYADKLKTAVRVQKLKDEA